jgi:hypothetical protein
MNPTLELSRRRLLRMLGAAPVLPLRINLARRWGI